MSQLFLVGSPGEQKHEEEEEPLNLHLLHLPLLLQFGHDVIQVLAELRRHTAQMKT